MTFTERLEFLRAERNIKQKDLVESINIPLRTYQRYEYGEREPGLSTIIALADYFDVSIDYLVGRSDIPKLEKR